MPKPKVRYYVVRKKKGTTSWYIGGEGILTNRRKAQARVRRYTRLWGKNFNFKVKKAHA
ncbi:hypothetical protein MUP01_10685 [Candidatus Bathyarchaeota archaeon]|nr:hypothetical protein [Candidatus Bathyarchaeota archaeon]